MVSCTEDGEVGRRARPVAAALTWSLGVYGAGPGWKVLPDPGHGRPCCLGCSHSAHFLLLTRCDGTWSERQGPCASRSLAGFASALHFRLSFGFCSLFPGANAARVRLLCHNELIETKVAFGISSLIQICLEQTFSLVQVVPWKGWRDE